jgi:hypothetical protein
MSDFRFYEAHELGPDGYPPEWHATIKHAVREAAGDRCVRCLHPYAKGSGEWSRCDERCTHTGPFRHRMNDGSWTDHADDAVTPYLFALNGIEVEARYRILTVHHLDKIKANCRWWNLPALCQRCHLTIQGRVRMERVYMLPHSEWFKPYVAGFYAFQYLGEDLDRESVDARLDELLGLELGMRAAV